MRKTTKLLVLIAVIMALFAFTFTVSAEVTDGWDQNPDGTWSYYQYGEKVINQEIYDNDKLYRLDENGIMIDAEWYYDYWNGAWYYYGSNGAKYVYCVAKIGDHYYGFDYDGRLYDDQLFEVYDENAEEWYTYYATSVEANEGRLITSDWKEVYENEWYFFSSTASALENGSYNMGGKWYAFDESGRMFTDGDYWLNGIKDGYWVQMCYRADADGVLTTNEWDQLDGEHWFYFGPNGATYCRGVYKIDNAWYGFGSDGWMYDDESFDFGYWDDELEEWILTAAYRAKAGGKLYVNEWFDNGYDGWNDWYYYGAEGKAAYGRVLVDGKYYLFDDYGNLRCNQVLEVKEGSGTKCYYADSNGYATELPNNQWKKIDDVWYYVQNGKLCKDGIYKIGNAYYCFYSDGCLVTNTTYQTENKCFYCADNGVARELANNQWTKVDSYWYYVKDGSLPYGITTVDGAVYYFFNGRMASDEIIYHYYYDEDLGYGDSCRLYAKADGVLAKNEWFYYEDNWRYAGSDYHLYDNGLTKIGPYYYYFYNWYAAAQNTVITADDGVYVIGDNCRATKTNGWFKHPTENRWMYANGTELYIDDIYTIDGVKYAFNWDGYLYNYETVFYSNDKYYLVNANGEVVTTYGWQKLNGNHYFVNSDGSLAEGWLLNGGQYYYMQPAMSYCELITEDGWLYSTNVKGEYKQITGSGFYSLDYGTVYLKNNKIVINDWANVGGKWYYFGEGGRMLHSTVHHIKGINYYFDTNGVMANKGWTRTENGRWVYANSDGSLYVGKDGAGYIFNSNGFLQVNATVNYAGTWYVTNSDGKAISSLKNNDWTKVNGYWYYVEDGELVTYDYIDDNGNYYYFDYQGRMKSGGIYGSHYLNSTGEARTGWIKLDGKWYYGDPDDYGYLFYDGVYTIDGKKYFFRDRILQQNVTTMDYYTDKVITTDADGVVIKEVEANGWTYDSTGSYGSVYYYEKGKPYTGWKGDYYIDNGSLITDDVITYKDKHYYLGKDGRYLRNGWYQPWGEINDYIFARGDGSLAEDEWIATNNGKYWYYFDGIYMAYDCVVNIDGKKHVFNADGVWMGEYKTSAYKDGWQKIGSDWYFYIAGEKVTHHEIYDGGNWYHLGYDGKMTTNSFAYYADGLYYYYGADGVRANYTGWEKINGKWCYFTDKGYTTYGWIYDGGNYYYQDWYYTIDKNGELVSEGIGMATGYIADNGFLYYFDSEGKYVKPITATGWYKGNYNRWYYVENGRAYCDGRHMIDNAYYAFYYDGEMVSNDIYDGRYYGADGKMITKQGWYELDDKWIYITKNGFVAENGIFLIDGKEYVFEYGYLVE